MSDTVLWIIVAVVAVLIVAGVLLAARSRRHARLHGEAEQIRSEVDEQWGQVDRRAALADETAAKARAARAEAEAKDAEATRLEERARAHRQAAESTRDELEARLDHADQIDPKVKPGASVDDPELPALEQPVAQPKAVEQPR